VQIWPTLPQTTRSLAAAMGCTSQFGVLPLGGPHGGVTENLDAARLIGLHPDCRAGLPDMAQQRSQTHFGHMAIMPEPIKPGRASAR
jgi:hypothetical protein